MQGSRSYGSSFYTRKRDLVSLSGWLFADLMLALAMLFFATSVITKPTPLPTPTPKPILPRLELHHNRIVISIDPNGILNGSPEAIKSVETQVRGQRVLHNRSACRSLPTEARLVWLRSILL